MSSESIIRVRDLKVAYGEDVILERVSFDIAAGEIVVILGGSGSGKSTLLRHIIGLRAPQAGSVEIDGMDLVAATRDGRREILRKIGVLYQSGALFGSMTLLENVRLPMEEFTDLPREAMDLIATLKLKVVGLDAYAGHYPSEVSGGMKKRAGLARAMALDPRILLLDEPSAGLDPVTAAELDHLILSIARGLGITFVVVTHELPSVFTIADRAIMLDRRTRSIIADGPPEELRDHSADPWVRRFFRREVPEAVSSSDGASGTSGAEPSTSIEGNNP